MENYENKSNIEGSANTEKSKPGSPDEIKERVKETVAKGVAAVAGALKGFSEEAKKDDLAGSTKEAIQKAGETTREMTSTVKKEFQETKDVVKGSPSGSSPSGGSLGSSSSMGMGGSSLGTGTSSLGTSSSSLGTSSSSSLKKDDELDSE